MNDIVGLGQKAFLEYSHIAFEKCIPVVHKVVILRVSDSISDLIPHMAMHELIKFQMAHTVEY